MLLQGKNAGSVSFFCVQRRIFMLLSIALILAGASVDDVYVIGGIPLSLGLGCGDMVLTVAVLAIVLTAPLGAFAIDLSYKKLLER